MSVNYMEMLANRLAEVIKAANEAGVAQKATWMGNNSVLVGSRTVTAEVIAPIPVTQGKTVIVQISSQDNKAYVIG